MPKLLMHMLRDDDNSLSQESMRSKLLEESVYDHDEGDEEYDEQNDEDDKDGLLNEGSTRRPQPTPSSTHCDGTGATTNASTSLSYAATCRLDTCLKSQTFKQLTLGYDCAAQMMISVLWAYVVPLAGYPKQGCPNEEQPALCWHRYILLLAAYLLACTFGIPLLSILAVKHCSSRVHEMGRRGSFFRRKFYARGLVLFGAALQTTWSVANSQFLYYVVGQFALTGFRFDSDSNSEDESRRNDDDALPPLHPFPTVFNDTIAGMSAAPTPAVPMRDAMRLLDMPGQGDRGGVSLGLGAQAMDGLPVLQEHLSRWLSGASEGDSSRHTRDQTNVDHPFGGSPESENEALNGLVASGVAGLVYFVLAMLCITSISAICRCSTWTLERCGCRCGQSAYLIELSLLLQNNWYYVLGYSWEMFWSYFWFSSLQTSVLSSSADDDEHALRLAWWLFGCDLARAFLFTATFSGVALRCLPFRVDDMDPASTAVRARVRLLFFRSTAVLVVVALADVPTSFVTVLLTEALDLSGAHQLGLLYLIAFLSLVVLTHLDFRLSLTTPPTKSTLFAREVAQWLVAFLVWTPWLMTIHSFTDWLISHGLPWWFIVVLLVLFGTVTTSALIFLSGLLHSVSADESKLRHRVREHTGRFVVGLFGGRRTSGRMPRRGSLNRGSGASNHHHLEGGLLQTSYGEAATDYVNHYYPPEESRSRRNGMGVVYEVGEGVADSAGETARAEKKIAAAAARIRDGNFDHAEGPGIPMGTGDTEATDATRPLGHPVPKEGVSGEEGSRRIGSGVVVYEVRGGRNRESGDDNDGRSGGRVERRDTGEDEDEDEVVVEEEEEEDDDDDDDAGWGGAYSEEIIKLSFEERQQLQEHGHAT